MTLENYDNQIETLDETMKIIKYQIKRILYIIKTSLGSSGQVDRPKYNEKIHDIIKESINLLPLSKTTVTLNLCPEEAIVYCSKGELISVFINLMRNAETAMAKEGNITIETSIDYNLLLIKFIDNGHGIPKENLEKIWEPFFTTEKDTGHGLGLSISHNIIQQHQGSITVESEINKGTTFTIQLPLAR